MKTQRRKHGGSSKKSKTVSSRSIHSIIHYLNTICSSSGHCLSFGQGIKEIYRLFDNFVAIQNYITNIKVLPTSSNNGVISKVDMVSHEYKLSTIMKCKKDEEADSLHYEFIVGKYFVNKYNKFFPCFLETFGLYYYNQDDIDYATTSTKVMKQEFSNHHFDNLSDLTIKELIHHSCQSSNSINAALLIQYFENSISYEHFYLNNIRAKETQKYYESFLSFIVPNLLLQLYLPLIALKDKFTHYDLHQNNVFMYVIPNKQYITMTYHYKGQTIKIKTRFIVKIIDYGRCYFYESPTLNTTTIMDNYVLGGKCHNYGKIGYHPQSRRKNKSYYYKNSSEDLNFAALMNGDIKEALNYLDKFTTLKEAEYFHYVSKYNFLKNIVYSWKKGVPEKTRSENESFGIYNIEELIDPIIKLFDTKYETVANKQLEKYTYYGNMTIHCDQSQPLKFTPA